MAGKKGRSGRKRKPASLLKLHGGYRKDRHGGTIPDPPTTIPDPPKVVRGMALEEWHRITKLLAEINCITELDQAMLAAYCLEYTKYLKAEDRLRLSRTLMSKSTKGTQMPHPLLAVSNRALANMMRICGEFGFSAAARARLNIQMREGGIDPLEQLIRNQAERRSKRGGGQAG